MLFGPALPLAERYARMLAGPGVERGLIGPAEAGRLWQRHLVNSAVVADLVPRPSALTDLGSGAGLPGIVLAMLLPEVEVTLLEPMARRVAFLSECIAELELPNARVVRGRAEDMTGQITADVVTARAVAPLERLAGLAAGLARPGGLVLAVKGAGAAEELRRAQPVLRRLSARDVELVQAGSGDPGWTATVVRFRTGQAGGRDGASATAARGGGQRRRPGRAAGDGLMARIAVRRADEPGRAGAGAWAE
ncbi:MAG: 16S rRNA (guanine(527)-N(7))-methyltransferase RsmG [Streptosporangiaceae bacterium]